MSTKDLIQTELDRLDEALLVDIYLFIKTFIHAKQRQQQVPSSSPRHPSDSAHDPLAGFIGAVSHGSLATNIDSDLYDV